jgi:DNA-binding CsgD family transcriptional regulator
MLDPARAGPVGRNGEGNGHAPRPSDASAPPNGNGDRNGHALPLPVEGLSPRMHQTLQRLLAGDSEKQIALRLDRSRHTVHVYVKQLYKRFGVCSRGELLARFVDGSMPK